MTDTKAPERVWVCEHMGEYGNFYPEAVEAEGEHGGISVEYVRADLLTAAEAERDALKAENERLARIVLAAEKMAQAMPRWIVAMADWNAGGEAALIEMETLLDEYRKAVEGEE